MVNDTIRALLICLFMMVATALLMFQVYDLYVTKHEEAHTQIFDYYDVNSSTEYAMLGGFRVSGKVIPAKGVSIPAEDYRAMMFLHSLNEVVGYHLSVLLYAWIAGIGVLSTVIILSNK